MGIGEWLFNGVKSLMAAFAAQQSGAMITYVIPLVLAGLTIYLMLFGVAVMRGTVQNSVQEFVWRFFKLAVICSFLVGSGVYGDMVMGTFEGLRDGLVNAITGGGSPYRSIDQLGNELMIQGNKASEEASKSFFVRIELWIAAGCFWLAKILLLLLCLVPLLIAYIHFYISMAIGPLAIACLLFPMTSKYFDSWLGTVLVSIFTNVAVAMVIGACVSIFQSLAGSIQSKSGANPLSVAIDVLVVFIVMCLVAWKASDLAAQWVGGSSAGNPLGLMASQAVSSGASAAGGAGARGVSAIAKAVINKIRPNQVGPGG